MPILERSFYLQPTVSVARRMLGVKIVREWQGRYLTGIVTETEAYFGKTDSASHAYRGRTKRNTVMFGKGGVAYVYLIYGRYFMLNVVTESENSPGAVLLRGVWPDKGCSGFEGCPEKAANGPGKLARLFHIDTSLNGWDLTRAQNLWFKTGFEYRENQVNSGPRIGIRYAEPLDQSAP